MCYDVISPGSGMSEKHQASNCQVNMSRLKKVPTLRRSFINSKEEVEAILQSFGMTGVDVVPASPQDTIQNPPEGRDISHIHIWHGGFFPFPEFVSRFLRHLGPSSFHRTHIPSFYAWKFWHLSQGKPPLMLIS